jgi:hypothetical protein
VTIDGAIACAANRRALTACRDRALLRQQASSKKPDSPLSLVDRAGKVAVSRDWRSQMEHHREARRN